MDIIEAGADLVWITVGDQLRDAIVSICFGAVLGALFDIFRILRIAFKSGKVIVFFEDIIYFALCGASTYILLLIINSGAVRSFVILCEVIGWVLYHFTIGVAVKKFANAIINFIRKIHGFLKKIFITPVVRIICFTNKAIGKKTRKVGKFVKNNSIKIKFRLKSNSKVLYNQLTNTKLAKEKKKFSKLKGKVNPNTQTSYQGYYGQGNAFYGENAKKIKSSRRKNKKRSKEYAGSKSQKKK